MLLSPVLEMERCPHCGVNRPMVGLIHQFETVNHKRENKRAWRIYSCQRCGGVIAASAINYDQYVNEVFPSTVRLSDALPPRARDFLSQAMESLHAPAGAVMLAASAVDSMLKAKDYKKGSLYSRIDQAAEDHLITSEMAKWAHQVRLDANEQRHDDEAVPIASPEDAKRAVEFAIALGEFIFVLPALVTRGISESAGAVNTTAVNQGAING